MTFAEAIFKNDMYERKIPIDLSTPLRLTLSFLFSKWRCDILVGLRHGAKRPCELYRLMPDATPRVLDMQMKKMAEKGLVSKTTYSEQPPRTEYSLTELGRSLLSVIDALIEWGEKNRELFGQSQTSNLAEGGEHGTAE